MLLDTKIKFPDMKLWMLAIQLFGTIITTLGVCLTAVIFIVKYNNKNYESSIKIRDDYREESHKSIVLMIENIEENQNQTIERINKDVNTKKLIMILRNPQNKIF